MPARLKKTRRAPCSVVSVAFNSVVFLAASGINMTDILSKLKGGDRRSIGNVSAVVAAVSKNTGLFKDLVSGLFDPDPIVRMRASDAMEKLSADDP